MAQWHTLHWDEEKIRFLGEIRLHPHTTDEGEKTVKASHDLHEWHKLDWADDGSGMNHLHDGVVDHVRVLPQARPQGVSVHAIWHDKDGNIVRQDAHFQAK
jgi:hypothetical protein